MGEAVVFAVVGAVWLILGELLLVGRHRLLGTLLEAGRFPMVG